MKILFGICSDGMGHCIQAVSVKEALARQNKQVSLVFSAKKSKGFPSIISENFICQKYDGFSLYYDSHGELNLFKTTIYNIKDSIKIIKSFINICKTIKKESPDVIFNFYDPLVGLSALFNKNIKYYSFGHQYFMEHKNYPNIQGFFFQRTFLKFLNCITSINSKRIGLSYYEANDFNNTEVWAPILRSDSYSSGGVNEDFILVYLNNADVLSQLIKLANLNKNLKFECFCKLHRPVDNIPSNLKIFSPSNLFLERLKICSSVICSGGFETTSEAAYHNKPILMVPLKNHYEQHSNSIDATNSGIATWSKKIDRIASQKPKNVTHWFNSSKLRLDLLISNIKQNNQQ